MVIQERIGEIPDILERVNKAIAYLTDIDSSDISVAGIVDLLDVMQRNVPYHPVINGIRRLQTVAEQSAKDGNSMNAYGTKIGLENLRDKYQL